MQDDRAPADTAACLAIDDLLHWREPSGQEFPVWGPPGQGFPWRLLDLRSEQEFAARRLPSTVCIPEAELEARSYELPPKWRPLILMAEDPSIALRQAARLRERGWEQARALGEPISHWPGPWRAGTTRRVLWEPAAAVQRWEARMPSGAVLDLGCGAGRDAVFLAQRGHPVTAIDRLPDALAMARALAARHRVTINTMCADLRHTIPPAAAGGYAAILMIRCLVRQLFDWIPGALRPGGLLILEAYRTDSRTTSKATGSRARLTSQEALRAFQPHLTILDHAETFDRAGDPIVRLIATALDER
ncbi:MAG: methyltransferase domain-containing protein [Candidatus Eisenbacteria sp.]|nr:methyltransferase domain-containing protein [Candidatus Eisenbacteria bacterium]